MHGHCRFRREPLVSQQPALPRLYRGLMLCGCIGVNGGGLNHYTGQEKLVPAASWSTLAMALDWTAPPRLQNGPSFHYVHSDQWRYEKGPAETHPPGGHSRGT